MFLFSVKLGSYTFVTNQDIVKYSVVLQNKVRMYNSIFELLYKIKRTKVYTF